jgi:thiol-disulfide isomerase/thioredoxin
MNPEMLSRLVWVLVLTAAGVAGYAVWTRLSLIRAGSRRLGLEGVERGRPVLVYFTTPTCAPCKTIQGPAIKRLMTLMGDCLQVVEIDASRQPDVADHWGVLSVPTTYILDDNGQPRHVNHGVAPFEQLSRQLANIN